MDESEIKQAARAINLLIRALVRLTLRTLELCNLGWRPTNTGAWWSQKHQVVLKVSVVSQLLRYHTPLGEFQNHAKFYVTSDKLDSHVSVIPLDERLWC